MNADFPRSQFFKGGGGGGGAVTVASSPPPPTQTAMDVQQAKRDAVKQAGKKRGIPQTVLAGETGGFGKSQLTSGVMDTQKKTLLGG